MARARVISPTSRRQNITRVTRLRRDGQLLERLLGADNGDYLVTMHGGRIVKVAKVEKPVTCRDLTVDENIADPDTANGYEPKPDDVEASASDATSAGEVRPDDGDAVLGLDLGMSILEALHEAGYHTLGDVRAASDEALCAVDGVGPATLGKIRAAVG